MSGWGDRPLLSFSGEHEACQRSEGKRLSSSSSVQPRSSAIFCIGVALLSSPLDHRSGVSSAFRCSCSAHRRASRFSFCLRRSARMTVYRPSNRAATPVNRVGEPGTIVPGSPGDLAHQRPGPNLHADPRLGLFPHGLPLVGTRSQPDQRKAPSPYHPARLGPHDQAGDDNPMATIPERPPRRADIFFRGALSSVHTSVVRSALRIISRPAYRNNGVGVRACRTYH